MKIRMFLSHLLASRIERAYVSSGEFKELEERRIEKRGTVFSSH